MVRALSFMSTEVCFVCRQTSVLEEYGHHTQKWGVE